MILTPLFNRSASSALPGQFVMPENGWFHLAPIGEFPHAESGAVQVIDAEAVQAMATAFQAGTELLIDFEHESHDPDKRTEAAGWIQNVEARADGLWMQPRWSDSGTACILGGRYRYISPVWLAKDCQQLSGNRVRPLRINDAGLTNSPNLKGLVPLANRQGNPAPDPTKKTPTTMDYKSQLLKMLGLAADATDEQITAAIQAALDTMKKGGDYPELMNRHTALLAAQAESDLDAAGITGASRAAWKSQLIANRAGTLPLLGDVKSTTPAKSGALTNRATAGNPGGGTQGPAVKSQTVLQRDAIREAKMTNRGCTNEQAYHLAKATHPEAFATAQTEE